MNLFTSKAITLQEALVHCVWFGPFRRHLASLATLTLQFPNSLCVFLTQCQCCRIGHYTRRLLEHGRYESMHVPNGVTVTSLSARLRPKTSAATDRLCLIALNRNYPVNSKSGVNFQVALKRNRAGKFA